MENMKRAACLCCLVLAIILAGASCGGKKIPSGPVPLPRSAERVDEKLFSQAEALFKTKQFAQAEQLYQVYLNKYPRSALAPAAWMQIAQIALENQNYEKARDAYRKILAKYSTSAMVNDASWGILDTYYREERFEILIPRLRRIAASSSNSLERVRAFSLLGDVYMTWGDAQNALDSYLKAHSLARAGEKDLLFMKMEKVLDLLTPVQAQAILGAGRDCSTVGLMALKNARDQISNEQWTRAQETLESLLAQCPDHQRAGEARFLLEDLKQMEGFHESSIGCLLPLSGPYERFGNQLLSGIEMALSLYNVQHPGKGYRLAVRDTQGNPDLAAQGFRELAQQNVSMVIGPMLAAEAIAQPARELGVPAIVFTQKESIADPKGYLFRNYLTLPMQARTLVTHARETLGLNRFAILYPNDDYGRANMSVFWEEVVRQGGVVNGVESYDPKQTDFADSIRKLVGLYHERPESEVEPNPLEEEEPEAESQGKEDEPDPIIDFEVVFIPDSPGVAGLIMPQLKFHDVNGVLLMGTNLWHSPKLIEVGGTYANGAIMPDIFFKESPDPEVREFISLYEDTYGNSPGFLEALGYDSANLTIQLMDLPQVFSRDSLRDALAKAEFHGVTGRTSFDQSGEVDKDLYLLKINRQRFVQVPKPESRAVFSNPEAGTSHERPY
ncbi:MAG: penicillin-binding protein activator [Desulfatibacillum sp.]|nr:penicillin-binding protein activator [Desulfatibacillum sp.]